MTPWLTVPLLAVLSLGSLDAGRGGERDALDRAIDAWDAEQALALAERMVSRAPEASESYLARARARFLAGRYEDTLAALKDAERRAGDAVEVRREIGDFAEFVRPLADLAHRFEVEQSEHFQVHFVDGPDRVLVERGIDSLEQCYREVGADFALYPGGKIRVEVFPDPESFERASTLTRKEIETSGTIALCKFNRLMMLSPRQVLRGFPWRDTLCHELTHYVLWKRNGPTVPIWLHEAVAKYEEVRWRQRDGSTLSPLLEQVLKGALDRGEFLAFDDMHPSFAKLKSPHDVALASAEVLSVLRLVLERGGYERLRVMLDALRDGADWRQMFERALEQPFDRFLAGWKEEMGKRLAQVEARAPLAGKLVELRDPMVPPPDGKPEKPKPGSASGKEDGAEDEASSDRHARLGDILRERGHARAAAVEYELAAEGSDVTPALLNRLGLTYQEAGALDAAVGAFDRAAKLEPEYAPTLTNLGLAERARGKAQPAVTWLEAAIAINPFDPRLHQALAEAYGSLGNQAAARRAVRDLQALTALPTARPTLPTAAPEHPADDKMKGTP